MHGARILIFILSLFLSNSLLAQNPSFDVRHYTDADGLPQNSVKFICADSSGFIWLTTEDGLVRFDGARFRLFNKDNLPITSNRFQAIFRGDTGKQLYTFNDLFEQVVIGNDGTASVSKVLQSWAQQKKQYAPFEGVNLFADGLIYLLKYKKTGMEKIYVAANKDTLYTYDGKRLQTIEKTHVVRDVPFATTDDWMFFMLNQHLYLFRENGNVTSFDPLPVTHRLKGDITSNKAYQSGEHKIGVFWNMSVPGSVIIYLAKNFYSATEINPGVLDTKLLVSGFEAETANICGAYYDPTTKQLFLGSSTLGLFVLKPKPFTTVTQSNKENDFYSQAVYKENNIITPQGFALTLSDTSISKRFIPLFIPEDYTTIFTTRDGHIYTRKRNIVSQLEPVSFRLLSEQRLPYYITVLYEGVDGAIWAGLLNGAIYQLNKDITETPVFYGNLQAHINYIQQVDSNIIFFGTANGLYKGEINQRKWTPVPGLTGRHIRCIYASAPDEIWVSTYGDGFFLLKKGRLISFPKDKGGLLASSHCIVEDRKGFFWIPTNKGLFQIAKSDLLNYAAGKTDYVYYHYHDKTEGFNTNEFNGGCQPCAVQLANGFISLPSMDGLVTFQPESIKPILPTNDLFIDEISLDNKIIKREDLVSLPRYFGQLRLKISSPYSGNANNLHLYYSLVSDGQQSVWLPVNAEGTIELSPLATGEKTLKIRKINGFGLNNFIEKDLKLYVSPAWYQTAWFLGCCLLLFIAVVVVIVKWRLDYIHRKNIQLEETIALKTEELLYQTKFQSRIIRSISHDIQTPLQFHELLSQKIYMAMNEERNKVLIPIAKALNESSYRLRYMINNLLDYLKVHLKDKVSSEDDINLYELVEEKISMFQDIATNKATTIENRVSPEVSVSGNKQLLSIILHNLIDNAVKVTDKGLITIALKREGGWLKMIIRDTGPGISANLQAWLNTPDPMAKQETTQNTGIGLLMVKELSHSLGLKLEVNRSSEKGTEFVIYFASTQV